MTTSGEQYILRMIVDVQNDVALKQLTSDLRGSTQALQTSNRQMGTASRSSRQLGFALQNAGFQASDFFVQVQGGVSVTRALSQQLPQLLSGFNILNPAIAASTAILATGFAVLPTIVGYFKDAGEEMRTAGEIATEFEKALQVATGDTVQSTLRDYDAAIEKATGSTRRLLEVQREYARQDFSQAVQRDAESITALITGLVPDPNSGSRSAQGAAGPFGGIRDISQGMPAQQLMWSIEAANRTVSDSYAYLVQQLQSGIVPLRDVLDVLTALQGAGLVGGANIREIITAGAPLISREEQQSLSEFVDDIIRLSTSPALSSAQAGIDWEAYLPSDAEMQTLSQFVDEINDTIGLAPGQQLARVMGNTAAEFAGQGTDSDPAFARQRQALIDQAEAFQASLLPAAEQYRLERERLNATIAEYNLSEEVGGALMEQLTARYREQADAVREVQLEMTAAQEFVSSAFQSFDRNFQSFVDGIARGTTDIEDAVKRMAAAVIADLIRIYATQALTGFFLGGGAPAGNAAGIPTTLNPAAYMAKGGVWRDGVQMFAQGGIVNSPTLFPMSRGRMGMMGEAGAEGIFPLGRLPNGDLGVQGAAPQVSVEVHNHVPGAEVVTSRGPNGGLTIDVVEAVVAGSIARGGTQIDSAIRGSYGLGRSGV